MSGAAESLAVGAKRARDEDEPVPVDEPRLRDHTDLQFEHGTDEAMRCERFVTMEHYHHRTFDRDLLERLGRLEEFDAIPALEGPPDVEALQRGVPPERQRILHRVERPQQTFPLREPRPPRITLDIVWEEQQRQGQILRLIMSPLGIEIHEWFRAPDPPQQPSGQDDEHHD
ncbi:hypothetical protein E3N88_25508 [Mikania micrantha]|uniref:Uncharacterized protein n=1 Tax=Mikania micrantha TaxID=192012 RepID=A0A5N6N6K6_9ASTR|nr:hypothetical protein E3N88_25508 [Mikania micrantha]